MYYPSFLGNSSHHFGSTELAFNKYLTLWKNGVLAMRLHGHWTYGQTPWNQLPYLGGNSMRSYYEGRYRDKCVTDATVELRQRVYRRSGLAFWLGVGTVYHRLSDIQMRKLLPEAGIGYRFEFKRDLNIRLDFGVGRHSTGFLFSMNEAF